MLFNRKENSPQHKNREAEKATERVKALVGWYKETLQAMEKSVHLDPIAIEAMSGKARQYRTEAKRIFEEAGLTDYSLLDVFEKSREKTPEGMTEEGHESAKKAIEAKLAHVIEHIKELNLEHLKKEIGLDYLSDVSSKEEALRRQLEIEQEILDICSTSGITDAEVKIYLARMFANDTKGELARLAERKNEEAYSTKTQTPITARHEEATVEKKQKTGWFKKMFGGDAEAKEAKRLEREALARMQKIQSLKTYEQEYERLIGERRNAPEQFQITLQNKANEMVQQALATYFSLDKLKDGRHPSMLGKLEQFLPENMSEKGPAGPPSMKDERESSLTTYQKETGWEKTKRWGRKLFTGALFTAAAFGPVKTSDTGFAKNEEKTKTEVNQNDPIDDALKAKQQADIDAFMNAHTIKELEKKEKVVTKAVTSKSQTQASPSENGGAPAGEEAMVLPVSGVSDKRWENPTISADTIPYTVKITPSIKMEVPETKTDTVTPVKIVEATPAPEIARPASPKSTLRAEGQSKRLEEMKKMIAALDKKEKKTPEIKKQKTVITPVKVSGQTEMPVSTGIPEALPTRTFETPKPTTETVSPTENWTAPKPIDGFKPVSPIAPTNVSVYSPGAAPVFEATPAAAVPVFETPTTTRSGGIKVTLDTNSTEPSIVWNPETMKKNLAQTTAVTPQETASQSTTPSTPTRARITTAEKITTPGTTDANVERTGPARIPFAEPIKNPEARPRFDTVNTVRPLPPEAIQAAADGREFVYRLSDPASGYSVRQEKMPTASERERGMFQTKDPEYIIAEGGYEIPHFLWERLDPEVWHALQGAPGALQIYLLNSTAEPHDPYTITVWEGNRGTEYVIGTNNQLNASPIKRTRGVKSLAGRNFITVESTPNGQEFKINGENLSTYERLTTQDEYALGFIATQNNNSGYYNYSIDGQMIDGKIQKLDLRTSALKWSTPTETVNEIRQMIKFTHENELVTEYINQIETATSESGERTYQTWWNRNYPKRPTRSVAEASETRKAERVQARSRKVTQENKEEVKEKVPRKEKKALKKAQKKTVRYYQYN